MSWQPIATAPLCEFGDDMPTSCLVYGPGLGVHMGRVWRYSDGSAHGQAYGFHGEWNITHWHALPEPPEAE